jgi:hypothetical protein
MLANVKGQFIVFDLEHSLCHWPDPDRRPSIFAMLVLIQGSVWFNKTKALYF